MEDSYYLFECDGLVQGILFEGMNEYLSYFVDASRLDKACSEIMKIFGGGRRI